MNNEYVSLCTGEIVNGIKGVVHAVVSDLVNYHIVNLRWRKFTEDFEYPMAFNDPSRRWGF